MKSFIESPLFVIKVPLRWQIVITVLVGTVIISLIVNLPLLGNMALFDRVVMLGVVVSFSILALLVAYLSQISFNKDQTLAIRRLFKSKRIRLSNSTLIKVYCMYKTGLFGGPEVEILVHDQNKNLLGIISSRLFGIIQIEQLIAAISKERNVVRIGQFQGREFPGGSLEELLVVRRVVLSLKNKLFFSLAGLVSLAFGSILLSLQRNTFRAIPFFIVILGGFAGLSWFLISHAMSSICCPYCRTQIGYSSVNRFISRGVNVFCVRCGECLSSDLSKKI